VFTTCTHCETRFRIHSDQLKAAQGLVRCAHCNEIFNALESLQEDEEHPGQPEPPTAAPEPPLTEMTPQAGEPAGKSGLYRWTTNLLWTIAILILIGLALAQLAWYKRDKLIEHKEGRQLLEQYCEYTGCQIPPQRALEKLKIVDRVVASHPEIPGVLRIRLTFENQAPFHQPFPMLQVSLFTGDGELEAQRRFGPDEYGSTPIDPNDLMQPGQRVDVELDVQDPGPHVTGFEFAFF
jgi:predicted Zn finger-like uncharacterized protein